MISDPISLSLSALAMPFRRPIAFLRCAALPYVCTAGYVAALVFLNSDQAHESGTQTTLYAVLFILSFFIIPLLIASYQVNWYRTVVFEGTGSETAPVLRIDRLTFDFIAGRSGRNPDSPYDMLRRQRVSSYELISLITLIAVLIFLGSVFENLDWRLIVAVAIPLLVCFGSQKDALRASAMAADSSTPTAELPIPKSTLRSIFAPIALSVFVLFIGCWWITRESFSTDAPIEGGLAWGLWIAIGFVTFGWDIAAQSLIYRSQVTQQVAT